jgi:hypothetical protein
VTPTHRRPQANEIWHPADDPEDCVIVTGVNGDVVFYQAPPDSGRGRSVPWNNSTNSSDFIRCYIPQDPGHQPTPVDLNTGTRGEYNEWVIETRLGRRLAVCVDRSPYPEDARQQLERLRAAHPGMVFRAVRETTTRTEEDW